MEGPHHVQTLWTKLRLSDYSGKSVTNIIREGTRFYYRKVRADLEGGRPLNRCNEEDVVQRHRAKLGASESWYRRRRGGDRKYRGRSMGGGQEMTWPQLQEDSF